MAAANKATALEDKGSDSEYDHEEDDVHEQEPQDDEE